MLATIDIAILLSSLHYRIFSDNGNGYKLMITLSLLMFLLLLSLPSLSCYYQNTFSGFTLSLERLAVTTKLVYIAQLFFRAFAILNH